MDVFASYAPFIQDFIYRNGWESLRSVQVAAADAIFNSEDNVLLAASTASGKTEAAFFPILSQLDENPSSSVGVLYIAPLKALINDQFGRLTELCEEAEIPVWRWHGDVAQSRKSKLLKHPSGILQITPESLEALLLHKHSHIPALFGDLRFIVIDEIHSLECAPTAAGNVSASSNVSRVSHHATRVASGCRQPSATSSLPDASSAQVRAATPSSPASRMRSSAGACPCRTSSWERAPRKWRREKMRQLLRDAVS